MSLNIFLIWLGCFVVEGGGGEQNKHTSVYSALFGRDWLIVKGLENSPVLSVHVYRSDFDINFFFLLFPPILPTALYNPTTNILLPSTTYPPACLPLLHPYSFQQAPRGTTRSTRMHSTVQLKDSMWLAESWWWLPEVRLKNWL